MGIFVTWKAITIGLAWLTFICFWIAAIFIYKLTEQKRRNKNWFLFLISVALVGLISEYLAADYLLKRFEFPNPIGFVTSIFGIVLLLSGLFFAVWSRMALGCFWSGSVALIENQPIIKNGPYAFVRHPIYAGVIAMLWGSFLLEKVGFILFIATLGTVFLMWKARLEEAMLKMHKGEEYLEYKKKVRGIIFKGALP